jgi:hypothetical protein
MMRSLLGQIGSLQMPPPFILTKPFKQTARSVHFISLSYFSHPCSEKNIFNYTELLNESHIMGTCTASGAGLRLSCRYTGNGQHVFPIAAVTRN